MEYCIYVGKTDNHFKFGKIYLIADKSTSSDPNMCATCVFINISKYEKTWWVYNKNLIFLPKSN